MNRYVVSAFTLASLAGSFAQAAFQSQTLIRLGNNGGLIQTLPAVLVPEYKIYTPGTLAPTIVPQAALLYDKRNPLPSMMMLGANFAFFQGGTMATVSEDGSLYYKGKTPFQPSLLGGVYFVNQGTNEVITVDSAGFYNFTGVNAGDVRLAGGNFFVNQAGVLTTIKHMGEAPGNPMGMITVKEGWDFSDAVRAGGNFFVKVDGTIVGIDSTNGFFTMPQTVESAPKQIGGNYFISEDNTLYTVTELGEVKKQMPILGKMTRFGYSYMIDADGDFIFVDGSGTPHTEIVRVSTTGIKSEIVKQIKDPFTVQQNFISAQQ